MAIAKKYQDELEDLKECVRESYKYFKENREYFNTMRKFVLQSNLTPDDISNIEELNRPPLQFNLTEAYVSRLLGEYAKQEPNTEVFANPSDNPPDADMVDCVEGHMRHIFNEFSSNENYRDTMTGGYSVIKLDYDYENENSFDHKISVKRVYDPLLTLFDPTARESHKGDGDFCAELYPMTEKDLKEMGYEIEIPETTTNTSVDGFKWNYKVGGKKVTLVCDYYKKKKKKVKLLKLSDNSSRTEKEYENILDDYAKNRIEQPPSVVKQRYSLQTTICRYRFVENELLEYTETSFSILPLIFVDGNSALIRENGENSEAKQIVKAYVHNARDIQRLMNMTGQQLAHSIETMVDHKMKIAMESVPKQYQEAYVDVQYPGNYIYKAYDDQGRPLPPPQEVTKMPLPPEVVSTFNGSSQLMQNILGDFNPNLGVNKNDMSGVAMIEGITQSNSGAMPYIVKMLESLQQLAKGILDLIPKLYVTPRSIPIMTADNKRGFILINSNKVPQDGKKYKNTKPINISYSASDLGVVLKPGVNFQVQQQRALQTIIPLTQALPAFASIINGKGLPILFDNLEIRGADRLKVLAEEQVEQQQMMQKLQQSGKLPQNNPQMLKIQLEQQKMTLDNQIKQAELELKQQQLQDERFKVAADLVSSHQDNVVQMAKVKTERAVHGANIALQAHDQIHRHQSDAIDHVKDITNMANDFNQQQQSQVQSEPENI